MNLKRINRVSRRTLIVLSVTALVMVITGFTQPSRTDEGAATHIFQIAVSAFAVVLCVFFATADWKQPSRSARPLAFPASVLMLAFAALYYLEHYRP
jgi:ABC-type uncharacterized transport system permease subunit